MDKADGEQAEKVAAQMRKVNEKGMNVYLRFGHEMNGVSERSDLSASS